MLRKNGRGSPRASHKGSSVNFAAPPRVSEADLYPFPPKSLATAPSSTATAEA